MKKRYSFFCFSGSTKFTVCLLLLLSGLGLHNLYAQVPSRSGQLFIENLEKFPSNEDFAASRLQAPWSRDGRVFNSNLDTVRMRLHNKGMGPLVISKLILSNTANWKISRLEGASYNEATALPLTISTGNFADLQILFTAVEQGTSVKVLTDEFSIVSDDPVSPTKTVSLHGLWQWRGEGSSEPTAQEIINAFGFKTNVGFNDADPDRGTNGKPKGDEVLTSYFVRVDPSRPVYVRQMGAYHGCCNQPENLLWHPKGAPATLSSAVSHIAEDGQRLLPRRNKNGAPAEGSFNPGGPFGFRISGNDWTDTLLTPQRKIGIRVWRALDAQGRPIPNSYIMANDYLGSQFTNYDYNDNVYFLTNVRPELTPASASMLLSTPSAVEFGEQGLRSATTFALNLKSGGKVYPNGSADPAIEISSIAIVGENKAEFSAVMPAKTKLDPAESTTLSIQFKPAVEGLKTADLLIYYNNASAPLRVPLYGIAKANGTVVSVPYRINSGASADVTVNGKVWMSDKSYAFDNLEPYTNPQLKEISATDDDVIYLREQSSNADKRPFRYEMPLPNGNYWVRLHFAEIYWGLPGGSLNGGAGSRVMSVQLENEARLINLDVAAEVGTASAVIKNLPVTVNDGKLNILFTASVNRPMVCAVEVYKFTPGRDSASTGVSLLNVYPNPLHQQFTLSLSPDYKGTVHLQLADVAGRVYELGKRPLRNSGTVMEINVAHLNLAPGVYFLKVNVDDGKNAVVKLLLQ